MYTVFQVGYPPESPNGLGLLELVSTGAVPEQSTLPRILPEGLHSCRTHDQLSTVGLHSSAAPTVFRETVAVGGAYSRPSSSPWSLDSGELERVYHYIFPLYSESNLHYEEIDTANRFIFIHYCPMNTRSSFLSLSVAWIAGRPRKFWRV